MFLLQEQKVYKCCSLPSALHFVLEFSCAHVVHHMSQEMVRKWTGLMVKWRKQMDNVVWWSNKCPQVKQLKLSISYPGFHWFRLSTVLRLSNLEIY